MKRIIFITSLTLTLTLLFCQASFATFPPPSIVFFEKDESKGAQVKEYKELYDLVEDKKFVEAERFLDKKIIADQKDSTPVYLKAFLFLEIEQYRQALKLFQIAGGIQMRHPALKFGYCQAYRHMGMARFSQRACQIAIEQNMGHPHPLYEYAQTLTAMGEIKEANKQLALAAKLDPKNPKYFFERGMNYFYLNDLDSAEKAFITALKFDPEHLAANYQLGYLYAVQGKKDKARDQLAKVTKSKEESPDIESAKNLLDYINKDVLDRLPKSTDPKKYHMQRSKAFYKQGKYGLSLLEIEAALRVDPNDLIAREILVGMNSVLFRLNETEIEVKKLIDLGAKDSKLQARAYQELGDIQVMRGNLQEAKQHYEKSKELGDPNNLSQISLKELPEGKSIPPAKIYQKEIFFKPSNGLNLKGELFTHYGMNERALAIFSMILKMEPGHLMSKLNMATVFYNSGKYNRAISLLERILVAQPNHKNIIAHRILLAQAYVKNGDHKSGINHLAKAIKAHPAVKKVIKGNPVFEAIQDEPGYKKLF